MRRSWGCVRACSVKEKINKKNICVCLCLFVHPSIKSHFVMIPLKMQDLATQYNSVRRELENTGVKKYKSKGTESMKSVKTGKKKNLKRKLEEKRFSGQNQEIPDSKIAQ